MRNARSLMATLAAISLVSLAACSGGESATADAKSASAPASAASKPTLSPVKVAPVSKVASAPGINPMDAKTIPPMPASARASGPLVAASGASAPAKTAVTK